MRYKILLILSIVVVFSSTIQFVFSKNSSEKQPDDDNDGVPNKDEIEIYSTNPNNHDTDGDGYKDWVELNNDYSPHNPQPVRLKDNDHDDDGLTDKMELNFHTDITNKDTDGDSFEDGIEIDNGYDPLKGKGAKLAKSIEINIDKQELNYFLDGVKLGTFLVSTGVPGMHTPKGRYKIDDKHLRAWSSWGLWMPYWMSLQNGYFGIHELPVWPNGQKEGEDKLGTRASHGCIRLGTGPAEFLYNWAPLGTPVYIY